MRGEPEEWGNVMNFALTDEQQMIVDTVRAFVETGARGSVLAAMPDDHALSRICRQIERAAWVPLDRQNALALDGLDLLFVELLGRCNEQCIHCYAESGPHVETALERPVVERVLREARALGIESVQFTATGAGIETARFANDVPEGRVLSRGVSILVEQDGEGGR